ncbi:MAG: MATE family efflux transporter [Pseudomonadota bacterium]
MADTPSLPRTSAEWHRRVWHLTWPVILANITIPLVGVADVAVMGRLPDPIYIGAVAMGAAMFSAVYWMFGFLRMGTTGLAAQAWGGGDKTEVQAIFVRAITMATLLGALIILLQWPLKLMLFELFDASPAIESLADRYYTIRIYGAPGLLIHLVQLGTLFGLQRMRDTLWLSIGMNVTNLVLDVVLVLGLGMGVEGVALGTTISEWGAAGFGFWLVFRALAQLPSTVAPTQGNARTEFQHTVRIATSPGIWQSAKIRALFDVSANLILRTFFVQLPFFAGTVLATGLGDITLAVHGILMQLFFVMTYSLDGFAHTAETLCGFTYGARQPDQLRQSATYCAIWGGILALATGALYALAGADFVALLSVSTQVQGAAAAYLPWVALAPLVCVWAFLLDGIFIGTTHIREMRNAMLAAAVGWGILLWLTYASLGYHAVWLSMIVFMLLRGILLGAYYPRIERGARSLA